MFSTDYKTGAMRSRSLQIVLIRELYTCGYARPYLEIKSRTASMCLLRRHSRLRRRCSENSYEYKMVCLKFVPSSASSSCKKPSELE